MPSSQNAFHLPSLLPLSWGDCRLLVESIADYAIFMLDLNGRVVTWNSGAEQIKGYHAHEIIGEHVSKFYTPQDVALGIPESMIEVASKAGRFESEGWRVRKDGSQFWASVVITALRDESGNLRGFGNVTRDLTAQRVAEMELRHAGQRFQYLVDAVLDYAIFMLDPSGNVSTWNSGAERVKGYTRDEIIGRHFSLFYTEEDRSVQKPERILEVVRREGRYEDESWRVRRDGSRFWANVVISSLCDENGKLLGFAKVTRDLSDRRRAEEELRRTEERLIREQAAREVAEQARQQSKCLADATQALGSSIESDTMMSNLARSLVPRLADWCAIYLVQGDEVRNIVVVGAEPSRERNAQVRFRTALPESTAGDGFWNVVRAGCCKTFDDLGHEMFEPGSIDPHTDDVSDARTAGIRGGLMAPIRIREAVVGVIVLAHADAARRFTANEVEFAEEIGRRAGVSLENSRLFAEAKAAVEEAEAASRAKDEFLATVSHELRTPLTAIVGWSSLLKQRITDPALYKPIDVILRNANAQVKIIDDILDVSRVITGKFRIEQKAINLIEIARDSLEVVRPSASAKRIQIECEYENEFHLLVADPERIRQVVWNLLSNAVKFTDPGGKISLRVTQSRSRVVLSVTDTGRGIDPAFLPFAFERFRQADASTTRRFGGLGLGLALVRHIVELHGGTVSAESEGSGKGACFTVTLPVRATTPPPSEGASAPLRADMGAALRKVTLAGVRVLVVDDEPDALELIAAVLKDAGALVQMACTVSRGLQLFMLFQPDVLISDIGMPGEDGYSFIRRVRSLPAVEGGQTPSLALSALARGDDRARAIAAGYTAHISKPVSPEVLTAEVASLATQRQP